MKYYLLDTSALLTLRDNESDADQNAQAGRLAYEQCQALPIRWLHEEPALLEKAAEVKATQNLSLADAWIAACALLQGAILVHKDPELMSMACEQIVLPLKR